jgi:hypothetical protein
MQMRELMDLVEMPLTEGRETEPSPQTAQAIADLQRLHDEMVETGTLMRGQGKTGGNMQFAVARAAKSAIKRRVFMPTPQLRGYILANAEARIRGYTERGDTESVEWLNRVIDLAKSPKLF